MAAAVEIAAAMFPLIIAAVVSSSAARIGLDSFYSQQYELDPTSMNDSFSILPSSLKSALPPTTAAAAVASLLSLDVAVSVNVKLVGSFSPSAASTLHSLLSSLLSTHPFHLLSPSLPFSLSHSLHLDLSPSPSPLSSSLSSLISAELLRSPSSLRSPLHPIPHSPLDSAIKADLLNNPPLASFSIFLLNLGPQSKPYAYTYSPSSRDSSPAYTSCLGATWTAAAQRYLWIDLSAGPLHLCPTLSGDCSFLPLSSSALHGGANSQFAEMASLIYSAYRSLLVPPVRIPIHFDASLVVQLVHIHSPGGPDSRGLDWGLIESTFVEGGGLLLGEQKLEFRKYSIDFSECGICAFAISRAMNSYTSRFLFDNFTLIVSEYVDSKRLHQVLVESMEELGKVGGFRGEDRAHVVPVFVFDLDYSGVLLLDRVHQAVAFTDMVVAVRTKNTQTVGEHRCNGRHMFVQTRELERPIVGSLLQTMWGVSPTHLVWGSEGSRVEYTWSMGQTPFGPFSEVLSLSFVQRDAARRNVLLTSLNYTVTTAIDVVESMAEHGGEGAVMKKSGRREFEQRWSLLVYKVEKAVSAISRLDFEMGLYFIRSSDHDLYAVHSMVFDSAEEMDASLVCFRDPPFPWGSFVFPGLGFFAIVCVYSKRGKLFKSKRKQF